MRLTVKLSPTYAEMRLFCEVAPLVTRDPVSNLSSMPLKRSLGSSLVHSSLDGLVTLVCCWFHVWGNAHFHPGVYGGMPVCTML